MHNSLVKPPKGLSIAVSEMLSALLNLSEVTADTETTASDF